MSPQEADTLGKRIINTFRLTPPLNEWRDTLTNLDNNRATAAFIHCRNNIDGALSIKRYLNGYRGLHTNRVDGPHCTHCEGSGWMTSHTDEHDYRYAKPCICTEGQRAAKLDMRRSWPATTEVT